MHHKHLLVVPAVLALTACGGGSGGVTSTQGFSLQLPVSESQPTSVASLDEFESVLSSAVAGDVISFSGALIGAPAEAEIIFTIGETKENGLSVGAVVGIFGGEEIFRSAAAYSDAETLLADIRFDSLDGTQQTLAFDRLGDVEVYVGIVDAVEGYSQLEAGATPDGGAETGATFQTSTAGVSDPAQFSPLVFADADGNFTSPSGTFNYSGYGALQWQDGEIRNIASGEVTMEATFGATSSTATIDASGLTTADNALSASFSGDVNINNETGAYASSTAAIVIGEDTHDAGIIGIFGEVGSVSSGAVFDAATAGETANGVFSVVQSPE